MRDSNPQPQSAREHPSTALAALLLTTLASASALAGPLEAANADGSIRLSMNDDGAGRARGTVLFEGERYPFEGRLQPLRDGFELRGALVAEGERLPFWMRRRGQALQVRGGEESAVLQIRGGSRAEGGGRRPSRPSTPEARVEPTASAPPPEGTVSVTVKDPRSGMAMVRVPVPRGWTIRADAGPHEPRVMGPGGVRIFSQSRAFAFPRDPAIRASFQQSGQSVRPFRSLQDVIEKDLGERARQRGLRIERSFETPGVARSLQAFMSQLYRVEATQDRYFAVGVDLRGQGGKRVFLLVDVFVQDNAAMQTWGYSVRTLEASPSTYEAAKRALIYAESHRSFNPRYIAQYNAQERRKAQASWAAHGRRMASNQAAFEARNRAQQESQKAINDAIMGGWRDRQAMQDRSHERFVNGIRGEQVMRNPNTGQRVRVESGQNRYWSNGQNEYVGSDDAFADPNRDLDGSWVELEDE